MLVASQAAPSPTTPGKWLSGAYVGPCPDNEDQVGLLIEELDDYSAARGRDVEATMQFMPDGNWTALDNPGKLMRCLTQVRAAYPDMTIVLATPMLPANVGVQTEFGLKSPEDILNMGNQANWVKAIRRGSNGYYDKYWKLLAENLVKSGLDDVVLRLGWEFNGDWYRWRSTDDPNSWRKYWARIVTAMRAVPGSNIQFDWSVALGAVRNGKTPEQAWPGPAWVDYVSVSLYDSTYGKKDCDAWSDAPSDCSTPTSRWNFLRTQPYGLNWQAAFANKCAPGTPLAFTEWALASKESFNNGGGADDAAFLTSFFNWVRSHPVAYEVYYNKNHTNGADDNVHEMLTYPSYAPTVLTLPAPLVNPIFESAWPRYTTLFQPTSAAPLAAPSTTVKPSCAAAVGSQGPPVTATPTPTPTPKPTATPTPTPKPTTTPPPPVKPTIVKDVPYFSKKPNRSSPVKLAGVKIKGMNYIFVVPSKAVKAVRFYVDDPKRKKRPYHLDKLKPFDLVGGTAGAALPFRANPLRVGTHKLTVVFVWKAGGSKVATWKFYR